MAIVVGTGGSENLNGRASSDLILAGAGADLINGGGGLDIISAGAGADTADGGAGSDLVLGEAGNDTLIYRAAENAGATDIYDGGTGVDRIRLVLTRKEWLDPLLQHDIAAYLQFMAAHTSANGQADGAQFQFSAFDLRVSRMEALQVVVDGVAIDPRAPVLNAAAAANYTENAAPVLLSPQLALADVDSQTLVGATVKIKLTLTCLPPRISRPRHTPLSSFLRFVTLVNPAASIRASAWP